MEALHLDEVGGLVLAEDGSEAAEVVVVRLHGVLHLLHLLRADLGRRFHVGERRAQRVERLPQQLAVHAAHLPAERRLHLLEDPPEREVLQQLEDTVLVGAVPVATVRGDRRAGVAVTRTFDIVGAVQAERAADVHFREVLVDRR